ncbi:hypothetical protein [Angustibacter luteus]|uniref:Uncharacterized protein n=1 Tax=Angustibacter luteus TaxID=658456 RepID=A0ABW1JB83_9ACTN
MDPSSLIFVVIVAIWAAYLLGHWVRRRDHLATVRSVDRFSEAMRVLERRPAVRAVPLSRPNPRSYVVAPSSRSSARPPSDVVVKRAPAVGRPAPSPASPVVAERPVRPARPAIASPRTPVRGLVLLGLLVVTPVVWLLVPFTALAWWLGALVTAALVAMVGWQRHTVRRARDQRRRQARQELRSASLARRQSRRDVVGQVVAANRDRAAAAGSAAAVDGASSEVESGPDDGSWQPVPVPPPTYTLKPKAPPVQVRPAAYSNDPAPDAPVAEPVSEPVGEPAVVAAAAEAGGFDLDEILERRIAANG